MSLVQDSAEQIRIKRVIVPVSLDFIQSPTGCVRMDNRILVIASGIALFIHPATDGVRERSE